MDIYCLLTVVTHTWQLVMLSDSEGAWWTASDHSRTAGQGGIVWSRDVGAGT